MTRIVFAFVLMLTLTGCYNLLIVNVGIGNKNAAALHAPIDPKAFCAALLQQGFTIRKGPITAGTRDDDTEICSEVAAAAEKKKGGRK